MFSTISMFSSFIQPSIFSISIYDDIFDINLSTSANPVIDVTSGKIWKSVNTCFKSFSLTVFLTLNNLSTISCFVFGVNLWLFTLIFASSFNTQNSEYKIDCFGITSSFIRYVHLLVILFINFSAVSSTLTTSSNVHGNIFSFEFLTIQANLLLPSCAKGPT